MDLKGNGGAAADEIAKLASAALDCELTRSERVRFLDMLLTSPVARAELERLLQLEKSLRDVARQGVGIGPGAEFDAAVAKRIAAEGKPPSIEVGSAADDAARLRVHPIGHSAPTDRLEWEDHGEIAPGETRRIHIQKNGKVAYHFRIRSVEPVEIEIHHMHRRGHRVAAHRTRVHGVHYASLERPRTDEVLVVTNMGAHPVGIEVSAGQRNAVRVA